MIKGIKKVKSSFFKRIDNPVTKLMRKEGEQVEGWGRDRKTASLRSEKWVNSFSLRHTLKTCKRIL